MTALANRTCSICGQTLEARDPKGYGRALREHTRTVHPELFRWQRRMRKIALGTLLVAIILAVLPSIFLQSLGTWVPLISIAAFVAPILGLALVGGSNIKTGLRSFRRSGPPILVPYDGCVFDKGTIILPLSSQDKLDTEEWIPLIISELLYQQKFRAKRRIGLLIRIVPLTIIYLILP